MVLLFGFLAYCLCFERQTTLGEFVLCNGERDYGEWGSSVNDFQRITTSEEGTYMEGIHPSSRRGSHYFYYEPDDVFYMFGGWGYDRSDESYEGSMTGLNDLWSYDIKTGLWAFIYGYSWHTRKGGQIAAYSSRSSYNTYYNTRPGGREKYSVAPGPKLAESNVIGTKYEGTPTWFIYGGAGFTSNRAAGPGRLCEVYLFSPGYLQHSKKPFQVNSCYGSSTGAGCCAKEYNKAFNLADNTTYNVGNNPRARYGAFAWSTGEDNNQFWIFGGSFGTEADISNEIWEFDSALWNWKWIKGNPEISSSPGQFVSEKGTFDEDNEPPARFLCLGWKVSLSNDAGGYDEHVFIYGGSTVVPFSYWSDLWQYNISSNQWKFVSGSRMIQQPPKYGERGYYSSSSTPGSRGESSFWVDIEGELILLLFGGVGPDTEGTVGAMSDIWAYSIELSQWMWVDGPSEATQAGITSGNDTYPSGHSSHALFHRANNTFYLGTGISGTDLEYCEEGSVDHWEMGLINDLWTFSFMDQCNGSYVYSPNACSAHGICYSNNICDCNEYWKGDNCEILKPTCEGYLPEDSRVCNEKGKCLSDDVCSCNEGNGFHGRYCDLFFDETTEITNGLDTDDTSISVSLSLNDSTYSHLGVNEERQFLWVEYQIQMKRLILNEDFENLFNETNSGDIVPFNCSWILREKDDTPLLTSSSYFSRNESDKEVCFFIFNQQNTTLAEYLVIQLGAEHDVSYGKSFYVKMISSVFEDDEWQIARIRSLSESQSTNFFAWLLIWSPVIFPFICVVLICCTCFLICVCCFGSIWGVVNYKQKKNLKKFKDIDDQELEKYSVDQQTMMDSNFKLVKINKKLFDIPFDDIEVEKAIASGGSHAVVFLAKYKKKTVALKLFKTKDLESQDAYNAFEKEVSLLRKFKHPNFLKYYGSTLDEPRIGTVCEFCGLGDIRQFMTNEDNERLFLKDKFRILRSISDAMGLLHENKIIHRDLKCDNILLTSEEKTGELVPKLIDFGLSRSIVMSSESLYMTKQAGTSQYMAPEVTLSNTYDEKCDVFSFGIMIYEIVTEDFEPYGRFPEFNIELKVALNPDFRPPIDERGIMKEEPMGWVLKMAKDCWDVDTDVRPSFKEIVDLIDENREETLVLMVDYEKKMMEEYERQKQMAQRLKRKEVDTSKKMDN